LKNIFRVVVLTVGMPGMPANEEKQHGMFFG